jgi:hypothetical protein
MDSQRIKVKIGEHEFEAEGPSDVVQRQFDAFKELIANTPKQSNVITPLKGNQGQTPTDSSVEEPSDLNSIIRVDGRVVSLTVKPKSDSDAALLVLYGQRIFRKNETVTASEVRDGLEHSGYRFARVDRLMQPLCDEGLVIKIGAKKATRYRLTNPGYAKADGLAEAAISEVA